MKAQLGKQTGVALALLATLLATLFSMGVFSVAQADTHSATRSFSATTVQPGDEITVTIALSEYGEGGSVADTLPEGFNFVSGSIQFVGGGGFSRPSGNMVNVVLAGAGITSVVYKVTAPDEAGGPHEFTGNFVNFANESVAIGGDSMVTVSAQSSNAYLSSLSLGDVTLTPAFAADTTAYSASVANSVESVTVTATAADSKASVSGTGEHSLDVGRNTITVKVTAEDGTTKDYTITVDRAAPPPEPMVSLSSQEPGAAVQITISAAAAAAIQPNRDIQVDLSAFTVPSTIAESSIDIDSAGYDGTPSNVVVNGKKVTMTVPNVRANGDPQPHAVMGAYSIRIKQSAGVTNAASAGEKTVKWVENHPNTADAANKAAKVTINRVIKLSKTSGTRGTVTEATFKGYANGSATVFLNGSKHDEVMIADNIGTLSIDTTSSNFKANQANTISAQDAAGQPANAGDVSASFTISPKLVVDPTESAVSKEVTLKLSDWPANNKVYKVTIGASDVTPGKPNPDATPAVPDTRPSTDGAGKAEFKVMVPATANRGTQTVKVTGSAVGDSTPSANASLTVGVLPLTVQPAMVVPGQQITIEGSGLVAGDRVTSVKIGNQTANVNATANSAGDIVIAVNVPSSPSTDGIGSGKKDIEVVAIGSGRVAEGSVEIPKATIMLDPVTSRRGTTVNVSGSGFPSGDLVQIKYDNDGTFVTVAAGSADASGAMSINFVVPSYARIGSKHNIEATSVGIFKGVTAKATHETPGAMVSLSMDSAASGQSITISGMNFPAFATVAEMTIGGVDVRPVPAPATSIDGDFESTVLVPQLELGNQTVKVRVSQTTITTFLNIGTVAVSRDPADVFASLGDRLARVWYLDRATQEWSFYDPDPDFAAFNTLSEVSSGQVVQIIVTDGGTIEFQDNTLYAGTNPIALD